MGRKTSLVNKMKLSALVALLSIAISAPVQAEIVVIGNQLLPVTTLSRDEIYRIYLGKTKYLPNGAKIVPIDQKVGTASRSQFYSSILRKTETEIKSYWSRITFSGQGNPPAQQDDDIAVRNQVSEDPNCLGYIDKSLVDSSVKIVYSQPFNVKPKNSLRRLAISAMMQKG